MKYKSYTKDVVVNGNTVSVEITVNVHEEPGWDAVLDQDWETPEQKADLIRRLESGEVFSACV